MAISRKLIRVYGPRFHVYLPIDARSHNVIRHVLDEVLDAGDALIVRFGSEQERIPLVVRSMHTTPALTLRNEQSRLFI